MRQFKAQNPDIKLPLYFPQRSLDIRRKGRILPSKLAVFPGYVFLELNEDEDIMRYQWAFRRTCGFYRFLRSNRDIVPLQNRDLELVLHFIKNVGPLAGKSKVIFDENSRIVVIHGPLSGLEGRIIKVDKRKGRAKIKLDLYGDSFCIDMAFETLVKANSHDNI
ncbi:MAG: antitermination protein NusG [Treponema sp.]|nr:antitermination protein NusG [Treponema sp.]